MDSGENVSINVNFNKAVVVTGTPILGLKIGQLSKNATYSGGNGTSTIYFNYTVQSEDVTTNLDYSGIYALTLNGSTVNAADNNQDALLTLPTAGISSLGISMYRF